MVVPLLMQRASPLALQLRRDDVTSSRVSLHPTVTRYATGIVGLNATKMVTLVDDADLLSWDDQA